jgi:hypothetical protein
MGVVIDEVIGEIEPSTGFNRSHSEEDEDQAVSSSAGDEDLNQQLEHIKERQLRLKAD